MPKMRKVGGIWCPVTGRYRKVEGQWHPVKETYKKIGGVWKKVYQSVPPQITPLAENNTTGTDDVK